MPISILLYGRKQCRISKENEKKKFKKQFSIQDGTESECIRTIADELKEEALPEQLEMIAQKLETQVNTFFTLT